jgi:hypothetical protein
VTRNDSVVLQVDRLPTVVHGGSESLVLVDERTVELESYISEIWVFHGLDRGDIVEMDTEILNETGEPLVLRSMHKEVGANFDAWTYYPIGERVKKLSFRFLCRVNGDNKLLSDGAIVEHRGGNRHTARPHWGVTVRKDGK